IDPDQPYARGLLVQAKQNCCDWRTAAADIATLREAVRAGKCAATPFFITVSDSPADNRRFAELMVKDKFPPTPVPMWRGEHYGHDRIRLAYLSADFRPHPVSLLAAGMFESHDRKRFETIAISHGPNDKSALRRRLELAFDRFIEVEGKNDDEIASLIRQLEI